MTEPVRPGVLPGWLYHRRNSLLPLVLFISLLSVASLNVYVQFRGQRLENQIAALRPAREYTRTAELAIALEMSALHSYALTHSDQALARFQRALQIETRALAAIRPQQRGLAVALAVRVAALQALTDRWRASVLLVDGDHSGMIPDSTKPRIDAEQTIFRELINDTAAMDEAIALGIRQRQLDIDRLELLDSRSTVLLCLIALLAGAGMLWLSRRVQVLAIESEQRRLEIERVMNEKANLMRGLSHDLRNPLGSIQGYAQLIEDELGERASARQMQMFEGIQRAVRTCLAILRDVVDLSRADVGSLPLELSDIDAASLLDDVVSDAQPAAAHAGLRLHKQLPETLPALRTDARRMQQILGNLLSNAIKYTPPGGDVWLRAKGEERWLIVEVSDTGSGIPVAEREKIFEEFYRMKGSAQRAGGFGVGLAISRKLARLMGGDITVDESEAGSTFSLRLPV